LALIDGFRGRAFNEVGVQASAVVSTIVRKEGAAFRGYDFSDLVLRGADFSGADLTSATFRRVDLAGAYFADVILDDAVFDEVDLDGAEFLEIEAFRAVDVLPGPGVVASGSAGVLVFADMKAVLRGHNGFVTALASSKCGEYLAAGHDTGMVFVWQPARSSEPVKSPLRLYDGPIHAIAWNPHDPSEFVTNGRHGSLVVWNWEEGAKKEFRGHSREILCADWSPSGRWVLSGGIDKRIGLWDADEWVPVTFASFHRDYVRAVKWNGPNYFASCGDDGKVAIWKWDNETATLRGYLTLDSAVLSIAWNPVRKVLACGLRDDSVVFWNYCNLEKPSRSGVKRVKKHVGRVWEIKWSADGSELYSVGNEGFLINWNNWFDEKRQLLCDTKTIRSNASVLRLSISCHGMRISRLTNSAATGYQSHPHKDRDWEATECSLEQWLVDKGAVAD
jgi:WD40 repeat protein